MKMETFSKKNKTTNSKIKFKFKKTHLGFKSSKILKEKQNLIIFLLLICTLT